jgi:hypothetical protein
VMVGFSTLMPRGKGRVPGATTGSHHLEC